jgi:hypothetical protein
VQAFTSKLAPEDAEAVVKDVRSVVEGAAWGKDGGPHEGEEGWEPLGMYMSGLEVGGGAGARGWVRLAQGDWGGVGDALLLAPEPGRAGAAPPGAVP